LPELEVIDATGVPEDVLRLAGQLALASHHPVAAAVARAANAKSPLLGAVEESGQGVRCHVDGREARLGRPSFCGAEQLANESASLDPEASIVAFSLGEAKYLFSVR
jgi:Cu2+-exporting ATPase